MNARGRLSGHRGWLAGFALGGLVGAAALAGVVTAAPATGPEAPKSEASRGLRDVLHTPPLLVERSRRLKLRYDVVCQADEYGAPCSPAGVVFARAANEAAFRRLPLGARGSSSLEATLPGDMLGGESVSYYAVIEAGAGERLTVPAGGAAGPQRVWTVRSVTAIGLGEHVFGHTRQPDASALSATWGNGPRALGLISGRGQTPIGPSAFDIRPDGSITLLDQVNDRLAVYGKGATAPRLIPISIVGAEGDLAIGNDGAAYVLDNGDGVVRSYAPSGEPLGAIHLAGSGVDMLRAGPSGVIAHGYPGDMWLPLGTPQAPFAPSRQSALAQAARSVGGGADVVVSATPSTAMFGLVLGNRVLQAWKVGGSVNLGEIQLAEPFRRGLLVVLRVWTDNRAEFVALVLAPEGLDHAFTVDTVDWAETAPLSRFRLDGETLYQLRSRPTGAEIVTFNLGGVK